MITFYHTADIHFGVENYGKIDSKTGIHSRLLDFKNSLSICVDNAVKENIDLFVFSGDAYKTAYPTPTQQKLLIEEFIKLYRAKIPVVIIVGNHDHPLSFGKANALDVFNQLPVDGFHVFSIPALEVIKTKNGSIQVVGIPWPTRNNVITKEDHRFKKSEDITKYISERMSEIIRQLTSQVDPNLPAILAGHLTVSNGIFSGSEKRAVFGTDPLFMPSELADPALDYVALGHLHRHQNLNPNGYPAVVYSGSSDRIDFGERKETKGYCKVQIKIDVEPKKSLNQYCTLASYEFIKVKTRPFVQIELKLDSDKDHTEQVLNEIKKHDVDGAIVKIIYHVPAGKKDKLDLMEVQGACQNAEYLVGIIPVRVAAKHERRADLKVDMHFVDLLDKYLSTRDDINSKQQLIEKAKQLQAEIEE
ncbi:exonuclease subunit SbcD [Candidatus Babeliales bacterium]|nr:exonuclease subunit SbcD [Candidatus Babeliales bacterium]